MYTIFICHLYLDYSLEFFFRDVLDTSHAHPIVTFSTFPALPLPQEADLYGLK